MNVRQLIEELAKHDQDADVLLANNIQGDNLHHLRYVDVEIPYEEAVSQICLIESEPVPDVLLRQAIVLWP
jgi:hypothetical protein